MSEIVAVCSADQIRLCREVASTSNSNMLGPFFLVKRDLTLTMNIMQHAHIKFKTNIILKNKKTEPPCLMQLISKACQYSKFWNTQFNSILHSLQHLYNIHQPLTRNLCGVQFLHVKKKIKKALQYGIMWHSISTLILLDLRVCNKVPNIGFQNFIVLLSE